MENTTTIIEPLFERIEEYGKTSCELIKLRAIDKAATIFSALFANGVVVLALVIVTLFLNIGAALWLGGLLGKSYYGFFCIAIFYGLVAAVLYFVMNKKMKKDISNAIISKLLN